jgi:TolB protein
MFSLKSKVYFLAGILAAGAALAVLSPLAAQATAPGGSILVTYPGPRRINIAIVSNTPALQQLMQTAFSLHGGFESNNASATQYVFHFDKVDAKSVSVTVESRVAGGQSFKVDATGATLNEAAYRAGDAIVAKLIQKPGFFAGKLAFVSERTKYREIYTSDFLGQQVTPLTGDRSTSAVPRFSPDGKKLLYTSYYKSGFPDIILFDLAKAPPTRSTFASYEGTNTGGTFSPDGQHVAMILSTKDGSTELFVADAQGRNLVRLTHDPKSSKASPTWSPDGRQIAFSADPRGHPLIYIMSATGGAMQAVPTNISDYCADPAWNPLDATKLAFMTEVGSQLFIAEYDFKTRATTVFQEAVGSDPCWLNDGRHLVFTHRAAGADQLYILDTETHMVKPLTHNGASEATWAYVK